MPVIYIIAGPPGIGKSTIGPFLVPASIGILNHDDLTRKYEDFGSNLADFANYKSNASIQQNLENKTCFGVESNLGFYHHYDLLKFVKSRFPSYHVYVKLLFTENFDSEIIKKSR